MTLVVGPALAAPARTRTPSTGASTGLAYGFRQGHLLLTGRGCPNSTLWPPSPVKFFQEQRDEHIIDPEIMLVPRAKNKCKHTTGVPLLRVPAPPCLPSGSSALLECRRLRVPSPTSHPSGSSRLTQTTLGSIPSSFILSRGTNRGKRSQVGSKKSRSDTLTSSIILGASHSISRE